MSVGDGRIAPAFTDLARDDEGRAHVRLRDPDGDAAVTLWVDESYRYLMLFTGDTRPDSLIRLGPGESATAAGGISPS